MGEHAGNCYRTDTSYRTPPTPPLLLLRLLFLMVALTFSAPPGQYHSSDPSVQSNSPSQTRPDSMHSETRTRHLNWASPRGHGVTVSACGRLISAAPSPP